MSSAINDSSYYVPEPSKWPAVGSIAMVFTMFGAAGIVNSVQYSEISLLVGCLILAYMFFGWFAQVASESEGGKYGGNVDASFRWSMGWFIFSEVMFFAAFFGALFYARIITLPLLGDLNHTSFLWPDFVDSWPHKGPAEGVFEKFQTMGPFWVPTINTALLLSSGVTLTIAHHKLREDERSGVLLWLGMTLLLGFTFVGFQAYEYIHAYSDLNLKLSSGIYGSTFYLLTGFHGFHVCLGAIMLLVVWARYAKGHFSPKAHFGFEGAAWYWHFVDVVWLGLYVLVYWL
ncbi:MAG: cytochrome c oxidase subunit 3 [Betaproteobacteria bacterium TMED156]|nr:MAG: cytochrome c oxidase subunit 3 [Betaproteobacteria bacterium TMED156]